MIRAAGVLWKVPRYSTHKLGRKIVLVNGKLLLEVESGKADNHVLRE